MQHKRKKDGGREVLGTFVLRLWAALRLSNAFTIWLHDLLAQLNFGRI